MIADLETEARTLRDCVYGPHVISDLSWLQVREKWMNDVEWLRKQAANSISQAPSQHLSDRSPKKQ